MSLVLYAHPFSSYCQKALIALYEYGLKFELRLLSPDAPENMDALKAVWPFGKFPVLVDDGRPFREASIIVERLSNRHGADRPLIPADPDAALEVRFWDRFFDNYVATPQQKFVEQAMRAEDMRDPVGTGPAGAMLDTAYGFLDARMKDREWVAGGDFSLADCSAAPQLFYADWTHPMNGRFPHAAAYRERLLARPSFARCVDEARPYRPLFPLGAPDRD